MHSAVPASPLRHISSCCVVHTIVGMELTSPTTRNLYSRCTVIVQVLWCLLYIEPTRKTIRRYYRVSAKWSGRVRETIKTKHVTSFLMFCVDVLCYSSYLSIILDLHFPSICYRKLLSPPVVPANNSARVGVVRNFNLDDLAQFMPVRMTQ